MFLLFLTSENTGPGHAEGEKRHTNNGSEEPGSGKRPPSRRPNGTSRCAGSRGSSTAARGLGCLLASRKLSSSKNPEDGTQPSPRAPGKRGAGHRASQRPRSLRLGEALSRRFWTPLRAGEKVACVDGGGRGEGRVCRWRGSYFP